MVAAIGFEPTTPCAQGDSDRDRRIKSSVSDAHAGVGSPTLFLGHWERHHVAEFVVARARRLAALIPQVSVVLAPSVGPHCRRA